MWLCSRLCKKISQLNKYNQKNQEEKWLQDLREAECCKKDNKAIQRGNWQSQEIQALSSLKEKSLSDNGGESYVKLDFSTLPGKEFYMKKSGKTLPESITTISSEKFPAKKINLASDLRVWHEKSAICDDWNHKLRNVHQRMSPEAIIAIHWTAWRSVFLLARFGSDSLLRCHPKVAQRLRQPICS